MAKLTRRQMLDSFAITHPHESQRDLCCLSDEELTEQYEKHCIGEMLEQAEHAFWAVIAKSNPQCKHGDLEPLVVVNLRNVNREAVRIWIETNTEEDV